MTETFHGAYEGGFKGMKASREATFQVSADQFVLKRPRVFFSKSLHKIWAKWTAVTALEVSAADEGRTRLELTTKARGMGVVVLKNIEPEALWDVLDGIADLKERFHDHPGASSAAEGAPGKEENGTGEPVPEDPSPESDADETGSADDQGADEPE